MATCLVFKVKYGETLRRFLVPLDEELNIDLDGLRKKVFHLFNFAPDTDLTLTYLDEDDDVVTLADEEDLRDIMRQCLNPVRITVTLNTGRSGRSYTRSSGSSTPMRSPRVQQPLNLSVSEILKSVPGSLSEAVSKLSKNLAKPESSQQVVAEIVDTFSKMGLTYLNQFAELSKQSGALGTTAGVPLAEDQKGSNVEGDISGVFPNANCEIPNLKDNKTLPDAEIPDLNSSQEDVVNATRGVVAPAVLPHGSVNLNVVPDDSVLFGCALANAVPGNFHVAVNDKEAKFFGEDQSSGRSDGFSYFNPAAMRVPADRKSEELKKSSDNQLGGMSVGGGTSQTKDYPHSRCPYAGPYFANASIVPSQYAHPAVQFKRSFNHGDDVAPIFHRGVQCDGCGVHPISGSRFKSKVKEDYDLCSICFTQMGNEADYMKMDRPLTYSQSPSFRGLYDRRQHCSLRPPALPIPAALNGLGMKRSGHKFDSRFIQDVNVLDGTVMAPSTPFTKIWRMKNNGKFAWPRGTQIQWIGGDRLSEAVSVALEIPADGWPAGAELDIALDFCAPGLPGRYISYWRMAGPSGQRFGQRFWVLIQVDASLKESWCESTPGLNLNLPPAIGSSTGPQIVDVNVEPFVKDSFPEPDYSKRATELVEPIVDAKPNKDQEINFPINDTLLVGGADGGSVLNPNAAGAASSISYPIIDLSDVEAIEPYPPQSTIVDVRGSAQEESENNNVEQNLLRELEEMGFKQVDLNKEILRMNEYNLEQSVDDLCGVAEWDPILDELKEMGFCDDETNKRLLQKNNGSIKRVVMDLINGERA